MAPCHLAKQDTSRSPYNLCQREANYFLLLPQSASWDEAEGQKSNLPHSEPSCCHSVRFGRKIPPRRSRNATQAPLARFGSAFSLILGTRMMENKKQGTPRLTMLNPSARDAALVSRVGMGPEVGRYEGVSRERTRSPGRERTRHRNTGEKSAVSGRLSAWWDCGLSSL